MIHQLRIYQINPNLKQAFGVRFRDHAMRIMNKYDFNINAMWYSDNKNETEFVYILGWADIKRKSREEHGKMVSFKI